MTSRESPRITYFNPEDVGYIPPDLGLSSRELCQGKIGNYVCCRKAGHEGDHAAHGVQWARMKPIPPRSTQEAIKETTVTPQCNLTSEDSPGQCCCNCKFHIKDFHHCATTGQGSDGKCVCSQPRGWICMPPEFDGRAFSGWGEHGLCEMHQRAYQEEAK